MIQDSVRVIINTRNDFGKPEAPDVIAGSDSEYMGIKLIVL